MRLMKGDKIVARTYKKDGDILFTLRAVDGVEWPDIPISLFGFGNNREVSAIKFTKWIEDRVFPEERVDADELLKQIGLDRYNAWEIAKKTQARLCCIDDFWVDFNNS